jgi:uncharacterized membrane protein
MIFAPKIKVEYDDFWGLNNMLKPKVLLSIAVLAALGNVLGFVMIPVGPQAKVDFTTVPLLMAAFLYGPIPAFITGILGSLVTIPQFGNPFSPFLWYNFYMLLTAIFIKKIRLIFAPFLAFIILWPLLGYWVNIILLGYPVAIWWIIAIKELIMTIIYGIIVENLLSNKRIRRSFLP